MGQLTDEQLSYIKDFFDSETAKLMLGRMQAAVVAEWLMSDDPHKRERCWFKVQALLEVQATLRDAKAMRQLDQHNQERRMYNS